MSSSLVVRQSLQGGMDQQEDCLEILEFAR